MDVYKKNGFRDREEYLIYLSLKYDVDEETVFAIADALGPNEDFDGLLVVLEEA